MTPHPEPHCPATGPHAKAIVKFVLNLIVHCEKNNQTAVSLPFKQFEQLLELPNDGLPRPLEQYAQWVTETVAQIKTSALVRRVPFFVQSEVDLTKKELRVECNTLMLEEARKSRPSRSTITADQFKVHYQ